MHQREIYVFVKPGEFIRPLLLLALRLSALKTNCARYKTYFYKGNDCFLKFYTDTLLEILKM